MFKNFLLKRKILLCRDMSTQGILNITETERHKLRSPAHKNTHHPPPQKSPSHTNPDISSEQNGKETTDKNKRDGIPGLPYTAANMRIKPK